MQHLAGHIGTYDNHALHAEVSMYAGVAVVQWCKWACMLVLPCYCWTAVAPLRSACWRQCHDGKPYAGPPVLFAVGPESCAEGHQRHRLLLGEAAQLHRMGSGSPKCVNLG